MPATPSDYTVEYAYDYQNRLVAKTVDPDGNGPQTAEDTHFIHDGNQIVLEFDGPTAADLSHRYLWGAAVDQILADETVTDLQTPGEVLHPLTDHLNTVRDLADSTGTIANHLTYDSYGNITSQTNAAIDHLFAFTGRMQDTDTGLQNNLNRWYDAAIGRWLSEDPISFAAGDANLYRYVGNGPLTANDPSGLADSIVNVLEGVWVGDVGGSVITPYQQYVIDLEEYHECKFEYSKNIMEEMLAVGNALAAGEMGDCCEDGFKGSFLTRFVNTGRWAALSAAMEHALTYEYDDISIIDGTSINVPFLPWISITEDSCDTADSFIDAWVHESLHDMSQYGFGHGSWTCPFTLDDIASNTWVQTGNWFGNFKSYYVVGSKSPSGGSILDNFQKYLDDVSCGDKSLMEIIKDKVGPSGCSKPQISNYPGL